MHQLAGRVQPGKAHPPSLAVSAVHWPAVTSRCSRPTSSGTPAGSVRTRLIPAWQLIRRAAAAEIGPPEASSPGVTPDSPTFATRPSSLTSTDTCGRTACPAGMVSPASRARRANSTNASAIRCPPVRRSGSPSAAGAGAASGSSAARTIAADSLSSWPLIWADPSPRSTRAKLRRSARCSRSSSVSASSR